MKFIDYIKRVFFTESDLGVKFLEPEAQEKYLQQKIINEGAQSKLLMSNPIFQQTISEMYLQLEAQLDSIEDTDVGADKQIQWVRVQRRALRQIAAVLDNKIAAQEQLEQSLKENQDGES